MNLTLIETNLLLFIYGEADVELETEIKKLLITDKNLREKHQELLATLTELGHQSFEPNETSLNIIMEESAQLSRETIY